MSTAKRERARSNPSRRRLLSARSRFALALAIAVLALYGLVMLVAFRPRLLGEPLLEGSPLTLGVALGPCMFLFSWLLTALYVRRAAREADALTEETVSEARRGEAEARLKKVA